MRFTTFLIFLALVFCCSCTVGPDFTRPESYTGKSFTDPGSLKAIEKNSLESGTAQSVKLGKDIAGLWWTLFQSRKLSALIELAITQNPDLKAAMAALVQAQEIAIAKQSSLLPSLDGGYGVQRQKSSGALYGNPGYSGSLFSIYNTSVNVSYTLDVFGSIRRQIEGYEAQAEYKRFEYEATYLSLSSNIVTTVILEASLREQILATQKLIKAQSEQLTVTRQQLEAGGASSLDVITQKTQLEQTRALLPPMQKKLEQTRHQLSVLLGAVPAQKIASEFILSELKLPENLPVSLPSKLLEQRPDIRAKEALLHSASAQVGVATAAMFPDFTVTANIGSVVTRMGDLFIPGSAIWSTGLNIAQPIFHGAELWHKRRAFIAAYTEAGEQYRSTVIQALQNVADTLSALEYDASELTIQNAAEKAALESLEITREQYNIGAVSYLALLSAETAYQNARLNQIKALAARFADTAALFQALGGGWWNRDDLGKNIKKEGYFSTDSYKSYPRSAWE